ncbi:MAG: HAD-IIB family hydrolase [Nitrososphaeraceae archaeon]|jgi:mannosyl-3-phosphoglycerate phosphatase family protein
MNNSTLQKIVFTDIDGTLIDIYSGKFEGTDLLVKKFAKMGIPVILCSAKTRSEQEYIRKKLGLPDPFIIENGGAVVIPDGYFEDVELVPRTRKNGYSVIEIGGHSNEIRKRLARIRNELQISFKGTTDMTSDEISTKVQIPLPFAKRMSNREYGETILEIDPSDLDRLAKVCTKTGLKVIHGGRYTDITRGNDKGKATRILIDLFKQKYRPRRTIFIGLGDSENDLPMLKLMDIPVLVQRANGSWCDSRIKNLLRCTGIGPKGWKNSFNLITSL